MLLAASAAGCSPAEEAPAAPGRLPVLSVDSTPALEIGVLEGDPDYSFEDVVDVARLASGNLAVADGGADRISIFTPDGTFVRRIGGRGEGPGEFRDLVRVYPRGSDSVWAGDGVTRMVLVFDSGGAYGGQVPGPDLVADSTFALDSWLHGRYWVDGALTREARAEVRAALDALPEPSGAPGFRMVRVAEDRSLWIREPGAVDATQSWSVVDRTGRPTALVDLPARFDPLEITADAVIGRWRGDSDVNFVRAYRVAGATANREAPAWLLATDTTEAPPRPAPDDREFADAVRGAIRQMAMAQEIHYASHGTYTTETDSLRWERPEGVEAHFVKGDARGWAAVFTHPSFDRICALAYGFNVPAGWLPGGVVCAPAR